MRSPRGRRGESACGPGPLGDAGKDLAARSGAGQRDLVEGWLDDPSLLEARIAAWIAVAAGPVLELAAAALKPLSKEEWSGPRLSRVRRLAPGFGDPRGVG
ncbi:MAG: hypothetical protein ACRDJV_14890 [Actinomycetota bacterium]